MVDNWFSIISQLATFSWLLATCSTTTWWLCNLLAWVILFWGLVALKCFNEWVRFWWGYFCYVFGNTSLLVGQFFRQILIFPIVSCGFNFRALSWLGASIFLGDKRVVLLHLLLIKCGSSDWDWVKRLLSLCALIIFVSENFIVGLLRNTA
jgi:hypothetical protein